jgi:DNA-directed RNA polymerase specialized sigma24 family protein
VPALPAQRETLAEFSGLREFGLALVRDDQFVFDHAAAESLVERLLRQASMAAVGRGRGADSGHASARLRAFSQFVRLYRRQIRRLASGEAEAGWDDGRQGAISACGLSVAAAIRALSLELRESLLIVVLGRFSHQDAATALDISYPTLVDRLTRARERLASLTSAPGEAEKAVANIVGHLRVVK